MYDFDNFIQLIIGLDKWEKTMQTIETKDIENIEAGKYRTA